MTCEKPVALIHSYLNAWRGREGPGGLSRVNILAVVEKYRRGEISRVCVTVARDISDPIKEKINKITTIPVEDLIIRPDAISTRGEIKTFRKMADEAGWDNLLLIGNGTHVNRIEREVNKIFKNDDKHIKVMSSEDILSNYSRYHKIIRDMKSWPEQKTFDLQEKVTNIPIFGEPLFYLQDRFPSTKIPLQMWIFRQVEKVYEYFSKKRREC
jgi:hypothetical protein